MDKPTKDASHFATLSPARRRSAALEMAEEIRQHDHQMSVLVIAIQNYIDPYHDGAAESAPKGEDAEIMLDSARQLLALLVDNISNRGQQSRLIECIEAMEMDHG